MQYSFFPITEPFNSGRLKVSPIHDIFYEEVGNSKGRPILFVHGGPGGGISPDCRMFFDPGHYRVVLYDQRGAGRSTPHAEIKDNTTWDLVEDIERLRKHLKIESWIVFGGSWGSTLALAYAETHPRSVDALILRGIFLCRREEIHWFYQQGASFLFPDEWDKYEAIIPPAERHDYVTAYYKRLTHSMPQVRREAALAWTLWEARTSKLVQDPEFLERYEQPDFALAFARIECHYFKHHAFLKTDDQLLTDAFKIRHIPTEIVHGRYDVVCPVKNAWDLKRHLPEATLHIMPTSGHSAFEPDIARKLVEITERFKSI